MRTAILTTLFISGVVAMSDAQIADAQDKKKDFKELDKDAMKAFEDGKYEESHKIWRFVHNDYPRDAFRNLKDGDPKKIAWDVAFYTSIVREGVALKHVRLNSDDAKKKAVAEQAQTEAIDLSREMMTRDAIPKAAQDKLIKSATQPLFDLLKKKDAEKK